MKTGLLIIASFISMTASAKPFQNSYIAFEVPDDWACLQEGVAWTCTPQGRIESKQAVIVMAAKVAGPEDNLFNFHTYLKSPKKITTRVGTPMPSQVMYSQERMLAGTKWIQAQHLGSEIVDFYTLYLATVKDQLAILVSFSAERSLYQKYNPIFDRAMKSLKIVANQKLLFPKGQVNPQTDVIGIAPAGMAGGEDYLPPPPTRRKPMGQWLIIGAGLIVAIGFLLMAVRKKNRKR